MSSTQTAVIMEQQNLLLRVYVQPKASRDQWCGLHGDEMKLAITAPPVDGKANQHIVKLLAKSFKVAKGQVHILKGELGRHKQIKIESPQQFPQEIAALL
ncbi:YggU family protein [Shewanella avicenniae]|uniref:UPF0235 protein JYB87_14035 n=1 Tax=Shewanella avicenniae TaxID=2814294 RepID=A0ABX7QQ74_9GAMM|nr:DUF167 family protein YggU [Shewanella avicenniae]QSX32855.1 YggU family protein [Shewanella avicenniae]